MEYVVVAGLNDPYQDVNSGLYWIALLNTNYTPWTNGSNYYAYTFNHDPTSTNSVLCNNSYTLRYIGSIPNQGVLAGATGPYSQVGPSSAVPITLTLEIYLDSSFVNLYNNNTYFLVQFNNKSNYVRVSDGTMTIQYLGT